MAYKANSDRPLFITATVLAIFGLLMVYSASSVPASTQHDGMSAYFFLRQLVWAAVGYVMMVLLMNVDYHVWQKRKLITALLIVSAASLLFVLTQPAVNGAQRWLRYGMISFQPSEIAKLVLLVFVSAFLHRYEPEINRLRERLLPCLSVVLFFSALIAVEPDLGQALCVIFMVSVLLFTAGLGWKYIGAAAVIGLPVLYLVVMLFPSYRFQRIAAFLNASHDPHGSGWQISQSLTAVGSGGLWGLGLGAGKQKLFFLPEPHNDFIFAVIGEELGLIGTTLLCLAFLYFFYRGVKIALKAPDLFGFYLGLGITLMVVLQAFINISMVLELMPTKGIALPFISQGGSSLLLNFMATGILLNISNYVEKG
ncbi:MAG: putative lipid II flippase FtsW [Acidobacteriia bacterium]|nr:putative lipid II flippase FtsW [Terriglobia bacterium]